MKTHKFHCVKCNQDKEYVSDFTTGYARTDNGKVCFDCCAKQDKEYMRATGHIDLYLVDDQTLPRVTNWPGTLSIPCTGVKIGNHNIAGRRYDVWFAFEGYWWHGVQYGHNTQVCHCKKTKEAA